MHQILESIFVYVQSPMVNRFSTALTESIGLSFIYKSLILRAYNYSLFIFLHHRIISESLGCSLKLCIKGTYTAFSCTRGKALPFYNSIKIKMAWLCYLAPHLWKPKDFSVLKVNVWHDTALILSLKTSANLVDLRSYLSATVNHDLKKKKKKKNVNERLTTRSQVKLLIKTRSSIRFLTQLRSARQFSLR